MIEIKTEKIHGLTQVQAVTNGYKIGLFNLYKKSYGYENDLNGRIFKTIKDAREYAFNHIQELEPSLISNQ